VKGFSPPKADRRGVRPVRPLGPGWRHRRERVGARAYPSNLMFAIVVTKVSTAGSGHKPQARP